MAPTGTMWQLLLQVSVVLVIVHAKDVKAPIDLTEDDWKLMLKDEWLVKFYAPWCPACKALVPAWARVASWSEDLEFSVGQVDVAEYPGLSGRFLITALPTIYHVKDGVFRQYRGTREESDFLSFVNDKRYEEVEPMSWWRHPNSIQMVSLGIFFKSSMMIRELHTLMTEEYGIPTWGSYVLFAVVTIFIGLLIGLGLVCLCDVIFPPTPQEPMQDFSKEDKDPDSVEDDRKEGKDEHADGDNEQNEKEDESPVKGEGDTGARKRKPKATTD